MIALFTLNIFLMLFCFTNSKTNEKNKRIANKKVISIYVFIELNNKKPFIIPLSKYIDKRLSTLKKFNSKTFNLSPYKILFRI